MAIPQPLISTKLHRPAPRPEWVARPALLARLATPRPLTLVCAPAGFGKTAVLSAWLEAQTTPTAWLSLDETDNDPAQFWAYVAAALNHAHPGLGEPVLALLTTAHLPSAPVLVTTLINTLTAHASPLHLVLDDYHLIDHPDIHAALERLIDRPPPHLRVLMTARVDPLLPVHRWRARGALTEIRAADLRLTADETRAVVAQVARRTLTPTQAAALTNRTEGWVAGVQLAALALQHAPDLDPFIAQFTGGHRHVADYLADEVLRQVSADQRVFLLGTAALHRLSAPLCAAVLGWPAPVCQATLETLERANVFVLALDDSGTWYRYHHLLGDMLRAQVARTAPTDLAGQHRRAAAWLQPEYPLEAMPHWLAAAAWDEAAALLARLAPNLLARHAEVTTVLGWLERLPESHRHATPCRLVLAQALLYASRDREASTHLAALADQPLTPPERTHWHAMQANLALRSGQTETCIALAQHALAHLPAEAVWQRCELTTLLGIALSKKQFLGQAIEALEEAARLGRAAQSPFALFGASGQLAWIYLIQAQLHRAEHVALAALREWGAHPPPFVGSLHVILALIYHIQNDLPRAEHAAQTAIQHFEPAGLHRNLRGAITSLALIRHAQGQPAAAQALLDQAESLTNLAADPWQKLELANMRAQLALYAGQASPAEAWLADNERVFQTVDPLTNFALYEAWQINRAHLALLRHQPAAALEILHALRPLTEAAGRHSFGLENQALTVVAHHQQGEAPAALAALRRTLALAVPEGYVRLFADKGDLMHMPLQALYPHLTEASERAFVAEVLTLLGPAQPSAQPPATPALAEPLSARELEVLALLAAGLSNKDVAARLVVSPHTAKKHTLNLFGKLGVNSRTQALARARELKLLP